MTTDKSHDCKVCAKKHTVTVTMEKVTKEDHLVAGEIETKAIFYLGCTHDYVKKRTGTSEEMDITLTLTGRFGRANEVKYINEFFEGFKEIAHTMKHGFKLNINQKWE